MRGLVRVADSGTGPQGTRSPHNLRAVGTVLLATAAGILRFGDGAAPAHELEGRAVRGLICQGPTWWAVLDDRIVARRDESGAWSDVATADRDLTCLLPVPGGAWCGTSDGHLLRLLGDGLTQVASFDAVDGRDTWHAVPSGEPYVRSIAATSDARALLASVHVGGIARSGNGGGSWRPTIDVEIDVHEVRAHPSDPRLALAAAGYGLAVSHDAGASWGMETGGLHATYLRAVAFTTEAALVSASDGPAGEHSALYRWTGDGQPMTKVGGGLPEWLHGNVDTGTLDASGEIAAFADDGGTVYRSSDGGRSWTVLAKGVGAVRSVGVTPD